MAEAEPVDARQSLFTGNEYFSFALRIRHDETVGDGACGGCEVQMLIVFNSIKVTTDTPANDRTLAGPRNGVDADFVLSLPAVVPARATSWSQLKARFR